MADEKGKEDKYLRFAYRLFVVFAAVWIVPIVILVLEVVAAIGLTWTWCNDRYGVPLSVEDHCGMHPFLPNNCAESDCVPRNLSEPFVQFGVEVPLIGRFAHMFRNKSITSPELHVGLIGVALPCLILWFLKGVAVSLLAWLPVVGLFLSAHVPIHSGFTIVSIILNSKKLFDKRSALEALWGTTFLSLLCSISLYVYLFVQKNWCAGYWLCQEQQGVSELFFLSIAFAVYPVIWAGAVLAPALFFIFMGGVCALATIGLVITAAMTAMYAIIFVLFFALNVAFVRDGKREGDLVADA